MSRKSYEDCDCCEGKVYYHGDSTGPRWLDCTSCNYNQTELELKEEAFWNKYDLDEAEMKGN